MWGDIVLKLEGPQLIRPSSVNSRRGRTGLLGNYFWHKVFVSAGLRRSRSETTGAIRSRHGLNGFTA